MHHFKRLKRHISVHASLPHWTVRVPDIHLK